MPGAQIAVGKMNEIHVYCLKMAIYMWHFAKQRLKKKNVDVLTVMRSQSEVRNLLTILQDDLQVQLLKSYPMPPEVTTS